MMMVGYHGILTACGGIDDMGNLALHSMYGSALVCPCMAVHRYVHVWQCIGMSMYGSTLVCPCMAMHWYVHVWQCIGMSMYGSALVCPCMAVHWYVHVWQCIGMSMYGSALVCPCMAVHWYVHVWQCIGMSMYGSCYWGSSSLSDEEGGETGSSSEDKIKALCFELESLKKDVKEMENEHQLEREKGK